MGDERPGGEGGGDGSGGGDSRGQGASGQGSQAGGQDGSYVDRLVKVATVLGAVLVLLGLGVSWERYRSGIDDRIGNLEESMKAVDARFVELGGRADERAWLNSVRLLEQVCGLHEGHYQYDPAANLATCVHGTSVNYVK
jgi:predicted small integral membrane protein